MRCAIQNQNAKPKRGFKDSQPDFLKKIKTQKQSKREEQKVSIVICQEH